MTCFPSLQVSTRCGVLPQRIGTSLSSHGSNMSMSSRARAWIPVRALEFMRPPQAPLLTRARFRQKVGWLICYWVPALCAMVKAQKLEAPFQWRSFSRILDPCVPIPIPGKIQETISSFTYKYTVMPLLCGDLCSPQVAFSLRHGRDVNWILCQSLQSMLIPSVPNVGMLNRSLQIGTDFCMPMFGLICFSMHWMPCGRGQTGHTRSVSVTVTRDWQPTMCQALKVFNIRIYLINFPVSKIITLAQYAESHNLWKLAIWPAISRWRLLTRQDKELKSTLAFVTSSLDLQQLIVVYVFELSSVRVRTKFQFKNKTSVLNSVTACKTHFGCRTAVNTVYSNQTARLIVHLHCFDSTR